MAHRDDDEFKVADAGVWMQKQSGGRESLNIPQGLNMWKPKKSGSHQVEFIPFKVTKEHFKFVDKLQFVPQDGIWYFQRTFCVHQGIGINNDSYACPQKNFGHKCPICEEVARLYQSPHKVDSDRANDLRAKDRQIFLIYDLDDPDRGLQLWEVAQWNFGRHLIKYLEGARKQDKDAYKQFYHPTRGFTVRLTATEVSMGGGKKDDGDSARTDRRGGGGKNTEYTVHQFYPRERDIPRSLLDHGYDLDAMIRELDYDTLKKIFTGRDDDSDPQRNGQARDHVDAARPRTEDRPRDDRDDRRREPDPEPRRTANRDDSDDRRAPRDERRDDERPPREESRREERPREEPRREESAPAKKQYEFASMDEVECEYRGEKTRGKIEKVNLETKVAYVRIEGREKPLVMDFDDLTLIRRDDTFDTKPKSRDDDRPREEARRDDRDRPREEPRRDEPSSGKKKNWDDEDDGRSFSRRND